MSNTKWLRRALLGGVALSVMATGAQADELSALKAQLEALQARVNTLEAQPAPAALPEGYALMTFERGEGGNADWANVSKTDSINYSEGRGFTIAVTPTADLPAPVAEVTVYGYIKGDIMYDFDYDGSNVSFWLPSIPRNQDGDHVSLTAAQSRFGIRSRVDTAVGQIRTQLEMDFESGSGNDGSIRLRLRHAVGHWDFAPGWTFSAGQWWNIGALLPIGVTTVDWGGYAGPTYGRAAQLRLGYSDGPISFAIAVEDPTFNSNTAGPNLGAYFQYDIAGGHQIAISGEIADWDPALQPNGIFVLNGNDEIGWVVGGGFNINLADVATFTTGGHYGEGLAGKYCSQEAFPVLNPSSDPAEMWCVMAGVNFAVSDSTSVNLAWGYSEYSDTNHSNFVLNALGGHQTDAMTVHANVLWQPVRQMRLGWEVHWGEASYSASGDRDSAGIQFGAWFFF